MFKLIQNISILTLAFFTLVATSGFNVHEHNCNCCETEVVSLVNVDVCCDFEIDVCESESAELSCCSSTPIVSVDTDTCPGNDCCRIVQDFHKIDNDFKYQNTLHLKHFYFHTRTIQQIKTEVQASGLVKKLIFISDKSPPKISVDDFIIFSNSLKIPV
jgi:hypothetical protein